MYVDGGNCLIMGKGLVKIVLCFNYARCLQQLSLQCWKEGQWLLVLGEKREWGGI